MSNLQVPAGVYVPMPLRHDRASFIAENNEQIELESLSGSTLHSVDIENQTHNQAGCESPLTRDQRRREWVADLTYRKNMKRMRWVCGFVGLCIATGAIVGFVYAAKPKDTAESTSVTPF
ncbi:hypothetical protein BGZ57DRAFT_848951 [Hyaloscypha finlandica]|nr:hypothetical protein BGZ57DRAFT_848951 [Hyaloscypha finlandica]